jgi:hypothetical protein
MLLLPELDEEGCLFETAGLLHRLNMRVSCSDTHRVGMHRLK